MKSLRQLIATSTARILILTIVLVYAGVPVVSALSSEQLKLLNSGVYYYDVEDSDFCGTATPSTAAAGGSKVYILGDSLTNNARTDIERETAAASFTVTSINANSGRAISIDTSGSEPTGLQAVTQDATIIKESDVIVVALGTNSGTEDLNTKIPELVGAITAINPSISIYWVNLFYEGASRNVRNTIISSQATSLGFTVIETTSANIELESDGIHPTQTGSATFATAIVNGLRTTAPAATSPAGSWDPLSLKYPPFANEQLIIEATKKYILDKYPRSPFARNLEYVNQIFTLSKNHDVNPLLVMAIARQENGFGQAASNATEQNNYFGIIQGSGYRSFPSVEAGIDYFVEKVGRHVKDPQGPYTGLTNFYEYLSIHQVGLIAYPGEYPENAPGKNAVPPYLTFDERMNVYTSWDPTRNSHKSGSPVYNPGIYFKNSVGMINIVTGLSISDVPVRGQGAAVSGCTPGSSGTVNTAGYSFPLAPQRKIGYSTLPCSSEITCHHDNTPAFDLSYGDVAGKSVYAIVNGTIDKIRTQDPGWCQSIQLQGADTYFYWYGHLIDLTVTEGQTVIAGQEIGKVATHTSEHTCNNTSSGAHLHIDRGCTINGVPQRGGSDSCRDPEFVPFLKQLYNELPS